MKEIEEIFLLKADVKMVKKLTVKSLDKKLHDMSEDELIHLIMNLYISNQFVEQSVNLKILGDTYGDQLLNTYKKKLNKTFNSRRGLSLENAQQVLLEFRNVCLNDCGRLYRELALYFAECATEFTMNYGDMSEDFYEALANAYNGATVAASNNKELYEMWKYRLKNILHNLEDVIWQIEDEIYEAYYSIPWALEENDE